MFSLEDVVTHLAITNPNEILSIDQNRSSWFKRAHVGKFLGLKKILMSLRGLDDCEIPTRSAVKETVKNPYPWSGPKDQQNKTDLHLALYNFIAPNGAIKFFVVSLVDPFFVDYIIFHQYSPINSAGKLHNIHSI